MLPIRVLGFVLLPLGCRCTSSYVVMQLLPPPPKSNALGSTPLICAGTPRFANFAPILIYNSAPGLRPLFQSPYMYIQPRPQQFFSLALKSPLRFKTGMTEQDPRRAQDPPFTST